MPATDVAFTVVFGLFVLAFLVLSIVTVTWAVRRDRKGRDAWRARQSEEAFGSDADASPPRTNGHNPPGSSPKRTWQQR